MQSEIKETESRNKFCEAPTEFYKLHSRVYLLGENLEEKITDFKEKMYEEMYDFKEEVREEFCKTRADIHASSQVSNGAVFFLCFLLITQILVSSGIMNKFFSFLSKIIHFLF